MSRQGSIGNLFRVQLRQERERRHLSQRQLSDVLVSRYGLNVYPTTVAKIEAGDRDVRIDELFAFADLFGVSMDALAGRRGSGADAMWAASKLSSNAQKMVGDVIKLQENLTSDVQDLAAAADRDHRRGDFKSLIDSGWTAFAALIKAQDAVSALASEFPLPGMK